MDHVSDQAARAVVRDLDGKEHELRELWQGRPAVLVFLRHFGCLFCREQAAELHGRRAEIRRRGAELVFIGNGNRHFAQGFKQDHGIEAPLYVDTKRDSYRALGMRRGFLATLGSPATWRNMLRARKGGFRQGLTRGDAWQNGGVLVVDAGGRVAFSYLSRQAGDHPPATDVLEALPREPT